VPKEPELFRVLLAGNLSRAKGSVLVSAAAKLLRGEGVEFHLLGTTDDGLNSDDVVMHGSYKRDEFVDAVLGIKPAMGLLPSLWPETYCHVLTEMWAAGVPVLGFDCGAVAERIRDHGGGWLFDEPTVEVVVDAIRNIRKSRRDLIARTKEVAEWQAGPGQGWTVTEMTDEYIKLYMRILQSRRSLAEVGRHEVQECQP
jgi:glycosyltransferase involved in cell wall biosynthesis